MAVLGSKGVGWKVSSFTKSLFCGGCGAASLDLRPVNVSQLAWASATLGSEGCSQIKGKAHTWPC
jgi:hypothetical protein